MMKKNKDMTGTEGIIRERLFSLEDPGYREFMKRLLPPESSDAVIGIRTPALRTLEKELRGTKQAEEFLSILPHRYYEENNLHGFLIEDIRNYEECIYELNRFLPYVDNWATCDMVSPRVLSKHRTELLTEIRRWMDSGRTYTIRYGIGMLMRYFLDENFCPEYLEMAASVKSEEYYVKMMVAWFFATALAKQYDAAIPFFEENRLDLWTHNKAIQKAVESRRIAPARKAYLKEKKRQERN